MSPHRVARQQKKRDNLPRWVIAIALVIVVGGAIVLGADFWNKTQPPTGGPTPSGIATNGRTKGDPKATIAFVEFSDFQ